MQQNIPNHLSLENLLHQHLPIIQALQPIQTHSEAQQTPSQAQTLLNSSIQSINWNNEEDQYLLEKVTNNIKNNQKVSWKRLSIQLNNQFHSGNSVRDRFKTRQRYYNFLDPNLKKGNWTEAEDLFIVLKKSQGLQWCKIKSYIQGRNDHQVKNRFYFLLKQFSKNDSYGAKMFTSQLKVTNFSEYVTTYLSNERNDKLKQIMNQCERRKTQNNLENQQLNVQVEVQKQVQIYPQVVTQERRSTFVVYNSEQQITLNSYEYKLPSFYSIIEFQGNRGIQLSQVECVQIGQCNNRSWSDRNKKCC